MRTKLLLVIALSIGASSDLRADAYPVAGVWAEVDQPTRIDVAASCDSYLKNPKAPRGHIVVFKGSSRTDFNGGYLEEETVNNIAVRKGGPNEFLVTEGYYSDRDGGGRPGMRRRSYMLRMLSPDKIEMKVTGYRGSSGVVAAFDSTLSRAFLEAPSLKLTERGSVKLYVSLKQAKPMMDKLTDCFVKTR
jgi:hypothetical protein